MSDEAARSIVTDVSTPTESEGRRITSLSSQEFYERLATKNGSEIAENVRQFVQDLLGAHDVLDQHVTLYSLKLRIPLPTEDYARKPILVVNWQGSIAIATELLESLEDPRFPPGTRERLVNRITAIDKRMLPTKNTDGSFLRTRGGPDNLVEAMAHFRELAKAVSSLIEDIQRVPVPDLA